MAVAGLGCKYLALMAAVYNPVVQLWRSVRTDPSSSICTGAALHGRFAAVQLIGGPGPVLLKRNTEVNTSLCES